MTGALGQECRARPCACHAACSPTCRTARAVRGQAGRSIRRHCGRCEGALGRVQRREARGCYQREGTPRHGARGLIVGRRARLGHGCARDRLGACPASHDGAAELGVDARIGSTPARAEPDHAEARPRGGARSASPRQCTVAPRPPRPVPAGFAPDPAARRPASLGLRAGEPAVQHRLELGRWQLRVSSPQVQALQLEARFEQGKCCTHPLGRRAAGRRKSVERGDEAHDPTLPTGCRAGHADPCGDGLARRAAAREAPRSGAALAHMAASGLRQVLSRSPGR